MVLEISEVVGMGGGGVLLLPVIRVCRFRSLSLHFDLEEGRLGSQNALWDAGEC